MKPDASSTWPVTAVACLLAVGCADTFQAPDTEEPPSLARCAGEPVFTVSPVDPGDIESIVPLGALNPPGHTFPTGHVYFRLRRDGGGGVTVETGLYAPGDMTLTSAYATEHVNAGLLDFTVTLECGNVALVLGHVTTLAENVFGGTADLSGWELINEYSTGGETFRLYEKLFDRAVQAGDSLGTTGGNPGQWALDVGAYDGSRVPGASANVARWQRSRYLHAVCPLVFYPVGPVADALWALVDRSGSPSDPYPCGRVMQDVPGTAQGLWFLEGATDTYPEDPHLALVWHNTRPAMAAISAGAMIPTLNSGVYEFTPQNSGTLNRDFSQVTPDGAVYGYTPGFLPGIVIVSMPDSASLWIEYLPSATTDPGTWNFTAARTAFVR